jgi:diguanylate cyclase (GGDEF)-like protein
MGERERALDAVERRRIPGYVGIVAVDGSGAIAHVSNDLAARYGVEPAQAIGRSFAEYIVAEDLAQALESFGGVAERSGHHQLLALRLQLPDGSSELVDVVADNRLDDEAIGLVILNIGDPHDRRRSSHLLQAQAEVVREIALCASIDRAATEVVTFIERALPGFRAAVYYDDELRRGLATAAPSLPVALTSSIAAAINTDSTMPGAIAVRDVEMVIAADVSEPAWKHLAAVLDGQASSVWSIPIRYERGSACHGCIEIYGPHAAHPSDDEWPILELVSRLAAVARDRLATHEQLIRDAEVDPLTGTPNRRVLSAVLAEMIASQQSGNAVCFIDLDRLKVVNDSLGHEAGDEVIREAARRLVDRLAAVATVGRFGGDEFIAISRRSMPAGTLATLCLASFESPIVIAGRDWHLSASIGAVTIDGHRTPGEVLRDADAAMYEAKREGRGRWRLFDDSTRSSVLRRIQLEQLLPQAIASGAIEAWYQPVVLSADWSLCGVELLARWAIAPGEWVSPLEFIPLVEELGLVDELGRLMLERAFDALDELFDADQEVCHASVNVSPMQLQSGALVDRLRGAGRAGRRVTSLCLEMTEQHMVDHSDRTLDRLHELIETGVGLAVDDFGTGYSSLGALHRLPARSIKIDRQVVARVDDPAGRAVIAAVVGVAGAYGMATVAEGVELAEQARTLRWLGVDRLQGYLFAHPEPLPQLMARVASGGWMWDVPAAELDG